MIVVEEQLALVFVDNVLVDEFFYSSFIPTQHFQGMFLFDRDVGSVFFEQFIKEVTMFGHFPMVVLYGCEVMHRLFYFALVSGIISIS